MIKIKISTQSTKEQERVLQLLKPLLKCAEVKTGHNEKYFLTWLKIGKRKTW